MPCQEASFCVCLPSSLGSHHTAWRARWDQLGRPMGACEPDMIDSLPQLLDFKDVGCGVADHHCSDEQHHQASQPDDQTELSPHVATLSSLSGARAAAL